jgi:hypothetical protein
MEEDEQLKSIKKLTNEMFAIYMVGSVQRRQPSPIAQAFRFDESGMITGEKLGNLIYSETIQLMKKIIEEPQTGKIVCAMVRAYIEVLIEDDKKKKFMAEKLAQYELHKENP